MATDEELMQQQQALLEQQAARTLALTEPYYPVREAAAKLGISLRQLYYYFRDPRLQIQALYAEDGRRFLWATDIRRIWVLRHSVSPKRSA